LFAFDFHVRHFVHRSPVRVHAPSTQNKSDQNSSQQAVADELRDQYFHQMIGMAADHVAGKEYADQTGNQRGHRQTNLAFHGAPGAPRYLISAMWLSLITFAQVATCSFMKAVKRA